MCGRFVDPNMRSEGTDTSWLKINSFPRRYNIKPTNDVLVLAGEDEEPLMARWWLIPSWFKGDDPKEWKAATFNARIEEAKSKPSFRGAWRYGRCLIPAGGYYEWTGEKGSKQPHFFQSATNEENLFFAGLLSVWNDMATCSIVTRAANKYVEPLHDRMPVILGTGEREAWLGGADDPEFGQGARVKHHPVAPFKIADEGVELIEAD
ncbi:SOS response-associated peptidase [Ketogulonicigenium vulgare]|uniref:SOS response-associated peptidase n=1 Tax=Ketogulonicigenium vulgare TaxID=92945 RepID=UPI00235855AF|nr:SOS response-associated peptidase [Ketogulonicigenium vulgare]